MNIRANKPVEQNDVHDYQYYVNLILTSSESGDVDGVKRALAQKVSPNSFDKEGLTCLTLASNHGHLNVVEYLLTNHADPNLQSNIDSLSPLHAACYNNQSIIVHRLLIAGANPNQPRIYGITPLHISVANCDIDTVKLLLNHGANPNLKMIPPKDSRAIDATPLHMAAMRGNKSIVKELLLAGADSSLETNKGRLAYHLARARGHEKTSETLKLDYFYNFIVSLVEKEEKEEEDTPKLISSSPTLFNSSQKMRGSATGKNEIEPNRPSGP